MEKLLDALPKENIRIWPLCRRAVVDLRYLV